jgi:hypothetical protein
VRESGFLISHADRFDPAAGKDIWNVHGWRHAADDTIIGWNGEHPAEYLGDCLQKRCNSIHMPRWASRITLEITKVRAERLQSITSEECFAEGIDPETDETYLAAEHARLGGVQVRGGTEERCAYAALWERINGPGSWDASPWVWAISFKLVKP